jgi:hypothetical protein
MIEADGAGREKALRGFSRVVQGPACDKVTQYAVSVKCRTKKRKQASTDLDRDPLSVRITQFFDVLGVLQPL